MATDFLSWPFNYGNCQTINWIGYKSTILFCTVIHFLIAQQRKPEPFILSPTLPLSAEILNKQLSPQFSHVSGKVLLVKTFLRFLAMSFWIQQYYKNKYHESYNKKHSIFVNFSALKEVSINFHANILLFLARYLLSNHDIKANDCRLSGLQICLK